MACTNAGLISTPVGHVDCPLTNTVFPTPLPQVNVFGPHPIKPHVDVIPAHVDVVPAVSHVDLFTPYKPPVKPNIEYLPGIRAPLPHIDVIPAKVPRVNVVPSTLPHIDVFSTFKQPIKTHVDIIPNTLPHVDIISTIKTPVKTHVDFLPSPQVNVFPTVPHIDVIKPQFNVIPAKVPQIIPTGVPHVDVFSKVQPHVDIFSTLKSPAPHIDIIPGSVRYGNVIAAGTPHVDVIRTDVGVPHIDVVHAQPTIVQRYAHAHPVTYAPVERYTQARYGKVESQSAAAVSHVQFQGIGASYAW